MKCWPLFVDFWTKNGKQKYIKENEKCVQISDYPSNQTDKPFSNREKSVFSVVEISHLNLNSIFIFIRIKLSINSTYYVIVQNVDT